MQKLAAALTHLLFASLILLSYGKYLRHHDQASADGVASTLASADTAGQQAPAPVISPPRALKPEISSQPALPAEAPGAERASPPAATREPEAAPQPGQPDTPIAPAAPAAAGNTPEPDEPASPQPSADQRLMLRLAAAYPDFIKGYDGNDLIWHDGTRMPFDDGRERSFVDMLAAPSLKDQFAIRYPRGRTDTPPGRNEDPGRIRHEPMFTKMYGNCKADPGAVTAALEEVVWLPTQWGETLRVTSINGVANALRRVSAELDRLPRAMVRYLRPSAGTYHCRSIAGTSRFSVHAFGAAIDINAKYGDYWRWSGAKPGDEIVYRNRIPWEIVEIFERHGFIWGGKWYHYDTLHFEYRPELLMADDDQAPEPPAPGRRTPSREALR